MILNMATNELIIQELFFKDSFSVDDCLSRYTHKSDLETLRRELKNYGAELQQQMSEILKTETEAIVNLAEYLTNLNSRIDNLSGPICQLREEIMTLDHLVENAEISYRVMLDDMKNNNSFQNNIHLKLGIISSSTYIEKLLRESSELLKDLLMLERIVTNFSFQKNYIEELKILTPDVDEIVTSVELKLVKIIHVKFLAAFKNQDSDVLTTCLRMYDNLGKQKEVYEILRTKVVAPYLQKLLTEKNLNRFNQDVDKIYEKVLLFMNEKMKILLNIAEENPDLRSYNFPMHSFWKEFNKQSLFGLPNITAPGNPELFQKRFKSTWRVLQNIAEKCGNINLLTEDDTFQDHIKRFNLPVYIEICYQKIAGSFEAELFVDNSQIYMPENEISCKLKPTFAFWLALSQCFSEDVYIEQLADQFLKLSMMLLSRYLEWFKAALKDSSFTVDSQDCENFTMDALFDLSIVENLIALNTNKLSDIENTVFKIMESNMKPVIIKVFSVNRSCINQVQTNLKDNLLNIKFQENVVHLQNVGAIPRLYRRTNRSAPKQASQYIVDAVKPVLEFHQKFSKSRAQQTDEILEHLIMRITKQYLSLVQEVLQSVCKTEESLRRLKSRNLPLTEETIPQPDTMSDEMKIREQIKYDVLFFLNKFYPLASPNCRELMNQLKNETC